MKHKKGSRAKVEPRHIMLAALAVVVVGALLLMPSKQTASSSQPLQTQTTTPTTNSVSYSEAEMHQFWDKHLKQLIEVEWLNQTLPYAEINQRLHTITESIRTKTGNKLSVKVTTGYHPLGVSILGQAGKETDQVTGAPNACISLFMPAIMDYYHEARARFGISDNQFPICVLTLTMHEAEHAYAINQIADRINVAEESRAWMETCQNTIAPLVEKYGVTVFGADASFYKAWLSDGKTRGSAWRENLYRLYGPIALARERQIQEK